MKGIFLTLTYSSNFSLVKILFGLSKGRDLASAKTTEKKDARILFTSSSDTSWREDNSRYLSYSFLFLPIVDGIGLGGPVKHDAQHESRIFSHMRDIDIVDMTIDKEFRRAELPENHLEMRLGHTERLPHILPRILRPKDFAKDFGVLDTFLQFEILDKYPSRDILFTRRQLQRRKEFEQGAEERCPCTFLNYEVIRLHLCSSVAASWRCQRNTGHP